MNHASSAWPPVELLKPHLGEGSVNVINVEHTRPVTRERDSVADPRAAPHGRAGRRRLRHPRRGHHPGGEARQHRILGTVYADGLPRVLRVDGYQMDMVPEGHMVLIQNKDQPGVIGTVGTTFGDASVNIADMVISREIDKDRRRDGADGHQDRQRAPRRAAEPPAGAPGHPTREGARPARARRVIGTSRESDSAAPVAVVPKAHSSREGAGLRSDR
jgi:hypothetical protein